MFADEALRCECGYEVRASDEAARVDEVRRHAAEAHGIDLSADAALDVVRRVWPGSLVGELGGTSAEHARRSETGGGEPSIRRGVDR